MTATAHEEHPSEFEASAIKNRRTELAVVGYGNWGSKHVRVLAGMPEVAVTVVDRDPVRLAEARARSRWFGWSNHSTVRFRRSMV